MNRADIHFPSRHEPLRDDVHALGALVGEILREQGGQQLFDLVELDRIAAIGARGGSDAARTELAACVRDRPPALARDLVRAFSAWFQAVNLAEQVHRIRRRREYFVNDSQRSQPGGVEDAVTGLKARGLTAAAVLELIGSLCIEPVFAPHSIEASRRTLLRKQQRIAQRLLERLDPSLTPNEARNVWNNIRMELTTAWQTEEMPRERLTVADEREQILFYLVEILYRVVPAFYEEVAQALEKVYGLAAGTTRIPSILHFGSWAGGDMDGNPDVHAKTIRETLARHQQVIVNRYFTECQELAQRLSQSASRVGASAELTKRLEEYMRLLPGARAITPARHDRMPYRVFLAQIGERLRSVYEGRASGYENARQFRDDLALIAASLKANKGVNAGLFYVERLLRRIDAFGFHLATLDVRQHASVLHQVIAQGFDDAQWPSRSSRERHDLLTKALERDRGPVVELDALGRRTLAVFDAIVQGRYRYGPEAIGYFIVSGASGADDVLAALLLARWAAAYDKGTGEVALDIAPQFESAAALDGCGETMRELLADPLYRRHLEAHGRRQCVLIGYSDSNKESGPCASRVTIHKAQHELARVLGAAGERHVLFHARGASVARGGGRIESIVRAAPAGAVDGVLRIREQGATIRQGYGLRPIAMRTLERAFNALSLSTAAVRRAELPPDAPAWLEMAACLAHESRAAYRALVYEEPQFYEFFQAVTPIDVIEHMQIGARSVHRAAGAGVAGLLPVPWVFAWAQTRYMIPGWYGAGSALAAVVARFGLPQLRAVSAEWFFLRNLIDDIETMLARADLDIAHYYDVLAPGELRGYGDRIRAEYRLARAQVLAIKDSRELLDTDPTLQRSIALRNPYVDPMNLMQVDLLQRWRASGRVDRDLFEALLASVGGIAQGLQSSG
ncbi:MAG TPA: phosphoenolpyruvate carboxylase [Steroidobacteraceae bacterium]|nr:phosphoenolpyruvate carboxylase [Steroidobacteraceae bacterium]